MIAVDSRDVVVRAQQTGVGGAVTAGLAVGSRRCARGSGPRTGGSAAAILGVLVALATLAPAGARAQSAAHDHGPHMGTRSQLAAMVDSLQAALPLASGERREELAGRIAGIRKRLEQGDVDPGDVLRLRVSGEEIWTGTFTVTPRRELELPDIEPIALEGALYSEVPGRIEEAVGRYIREPRVSAEILKRVAVVGQVGSPGFYNVEASALVADVIMRAGGPAGEAKLRKVRIRRQGERLAIEEPQIAYQSITLDQLGVRSGDELYVPGGGVSPTRVFFGLLGLATSVTLLITRL